MVITITVWQTTLDTGPEAGNNKISGAARTLELHDSRGDVVQKLDTKFDPTKALEWMRKCDRFEADRSGQAPGLASAGPQTISIKRFIDVQKDCLVEASSLPSAPIFAALSYVWGMQQKVTCTNSYIAQLRQPGFISQTNLDIPQTIRDAIRVCRDIKIPLLWVDALCIQQDNHDEITDQIGNMRQVYEQAIVTIVALSGTNAEAGIAGVTPGSRESQARIKVQGFDLILEEMGLKGVLQSTQWSTRGWTHQEFLLAPKRLVFSSNQVFFVCNHGIFAEDHVKHHRSEKDVGWFEWPDELSWHNRLEGYQIIWTELGWEIYAELVSTYTTKNLTSQEDAMAAFSAAMAVTKRNCFPDSEYSWGMFSSCLDAALLWRRCLGCDCGNLSSGLPRRVLVTNSAGYLEQPPSWSWVGRQGHVKYSTWLLNNKNPDTSLISRVRWPDQVFSSGRYLHLEADTAVFPIRGRRFNISPVPRERGFYLLSDASRVIGGELGYPLAVVDGKTGLNCGVVYDDEEIEELKVPCEVTLVKLSQTFLAEARTSFKTQKTFSETVTGPGRDWLNDVHWPAFDDPDLENEASNSVDMDGRPKKDLLHGFFNYDKYDCDRKWPVYNVMMVKPSGDRWVRLGIGKIHVDAFDAAESFECRKLCLE